MSEKEKDLIKRIVITVPMLSKEKQNYILGVAEGMVIAKEEIYGNKSKREAIYEN